MRCERGRPFGSTFAIQYGFNVHTAANRHSCLERWRRGSYLTREFTEEEFTEVEILNYGSPGRLKKERHIYPLF